MLAEGSVKDIGDNEKVREVYLGSMGIMDA